MIPMTARSPIDSPGKSLKCALMLLALLASFTDLGTPVFADDARRVRVVIAGQDDGAQPAGGDVSATFRLKLACVS